MSSSPSQPGLLLGLDENNNPDLTVRTGHRDAAIKECHPIRDVDWRDEPQPIDSGMKFRAAYGQRCGMVAPEEQTCTRCFKENGVFASCVVNIVDGELQTGGACMNCSWHNKAFRCSFRQNLPDWVIEYTHRMDLSFAYPESIEYEYSSPENSTGSPIETSLSTPSAQSFLSSPALRALESPLSPYSTGMFKPLPVEWYSSPLEHLELQDVGSMQQIRQELLRAHHQMEQDIMWLTAEIQKETRNELLQGLLSTGISS